MGQHKYNQTAIDAAAGKLPPKPQRIGRVEARRRLRERLYEEMMKAAGEDLEEEKVENL